jgi:hypothetical protein
MKKDIALKKVTIGVPLISNSYKNRTPKKIKKAGDLLVFIGSMVAIIASFYTPPGWVVMLGGAAAFAGRFLLKCVGIIDTQTNSITNLKTKIMKERKGIFTPDQEKLWDKLVEFDNPVIEAGDGMIIQLADNQGLEKLKQSMEKKHPGVSEEYLYPIVDGIMKIVEQIVESKKAESQ